MKFFSSYSLLTILNESIRLLRRNGRLISLIACFSMLLSLLFSFLFFYFAQSLGTDMMVTVQQSLVPDPTSFTMPDPVPDPTSFTMPDPGSFASADPSSFTSATGFDSAQTIGLLDHLKGDLAIFFAVEIAFFFTFSAILFFSAICTILVSVESYNARNLSLKVLFSMIWTSWTRPLITSFYVSCFSVGYSASVAILASPLMMCPNLDYLKVAIFVGTPALILYLYLLVPWTLSVVVSVVEESCYGMEALGKGGALVKGRRLHGFLLNIFFNLVVLLICQGFKMMLATNGQVIKIYFMLLTSVLALVKIFAVVAYTVFYFQCREHHGEEMQLLGNLQYSKLPTAVLSNEMV